jgi:hypothetical protein
MTAPCVRIGQRLAGSPDDGLHPPYNFMPRLMISFMISEVPAKMRWMREFAYILQIGYSHI